MSVKLRLSRQGTTGRPFYWVIAIDSRSARNGAFLEKLGTYNPLLPSEDSTRVTLSKDRIAYWLSVGAIPTERVIKLFELFSIALPENVKSDHMRRIKSRRIKPAKKDQTAAAA